MGHSYVGGRQRGTHDKVCMHVQPSVQTTTTIGVVCGPTPAWWSVAASDARFDARYRRHGCNTSLNQANDLDECLTQTSCSPAVVSGSHGPWHRSFARARASPNSKIVGGAG